MGIPYEGKAVADAPKEVVWSLLADYGNIAAWTDQVKTSEVTSDHQEGVGATRVCELAPFGSTVETITDWVHGDSITMEIVPKGMPVKGSLTTFSLKDLSDSRTEITMSGEADPKGGVFKGMLAKRLEKRLPRAATLLVTDLARASEAQVAA